MQGAVDFFFCFSDFGYVKEGAHLDLFFLRFSLCSKSLSSSNAAPTATNGSSRDSNSNSNNNSNNNNNNMNNQ